MKIYSKEEIKKAEQVDIVAFIQSHGKGELVGGGRYPKYQINGHNTIVIDRKRNGFYHNGQSKGNNIIGLLTEYEGYRFTEAVGFLLGEEIESHVPYDESNEPEEAYHYQYEKDTTLDRAEQYLVNERGIDPDIFHYLVEHDYLIQDKKFKSAVFHWKELGLPDEETVGATSIPTP